MKIEVAERQDDGILSFKAETQAERLQLEWILKKPKPYTWMLLLLRAGMMTEAESRS